MLRLPHTAQLSALLRTLQDHYPELLRAALLLRVPLMFDVTWRLVRPLLDSKTAAKVHFVRDMLERQSLQEQLVPMDIVPREYGGTADAALVPNLPGQSNVTTTILDEERSTWSRLKPL